MKSGRYILIAFTALLPASVLAQPYQNVINLHASVLPTVLGEPLEKNDQEILNRSIWIYPDLQVVINNEFVTEVRQKQIEPVKAPLEESAKLQEQENVDMQVFMETLKAL